MGERLIEPGTKMYHIPTGEIVIVIKPTFAGWYKCLRPDGKERSIPLSELTTKLPESEKKP